MAFQLTADQRLAVENSGGELLVSAAAGSGKTRVLVERLLDRIYAGADVKDFLIITFTNAAAAELKQRIGEELNAALAQRGKDRHLRRQLLLVYQSHVSTIHAFCQDVLRSWGYLLDLDSDFRLCDQGEGEVLQQEALEELFEEAYAHPDENLALLLDTFSPGRDDLGLMQMTLDVYSKLQSHPDPSAWMEEQRCRLRELDRVTDPAQTPWGSYLLARLKKLAEYWYDQLAPITLECGEGVPKYVPSLAETVRDLEELKGVERWEEAKAPHFPRLGSSAKCPDPELAERAKALRESCKKQFEKAAAPFQRSGEAVMEDLRQVAPAAAELLLFVEKFSQRFQLVKKRRNVLDFNDLEHSTLRLLKTHPEVAAELSDRFAEVMVDEYQDTNEVQNAIFDALTARRGNLFMVGDVKQSIYRFRLADPTIFLRKYLSYPPAWEAKAGQGRRVTLGENFRSRPEVIACVNFLFENLMSRDMGEMDYGAEEALKAGGSFPPRQDCQPEFHLIANPKADEEGDNTMAEPRFVARRLRQLLDEQFPVSDGQGGFRPVRPEDMAILHRAPGRVLSRFQRALEEAGIPWESEGAEDFFDTPETSVALSYLEIIDNPRQDVPLIAVLRSPLYGYTPDRLAQLRALKGEGCYFDALLADDGEDTKAFLEELGRLRLLSRDKRSYELLWEVYCSAGMMALYSAMDSGESRREHLLGLYSYARKFDSSGHKGLFGFLNHLRQRRQRGEGLTLEGGGGSGGVKIMSIHRSKGLEYPVVVVAGLGKRLNHMDAQAPMLFHRELGLGPNGFDARRLIRYPTLARWAVAEKLEEEMRGEELRLLYVALTRAKEKLIMTCAMKDPQREVEKLMDFAALPPSPQVLSRQSTVGHWILCAVLNRPEAKEIRFGKLPLQPVPAEEDLGGEWLITLQQGDTRVFPRLSPQVTPGETGAAPLSLPDYTWVYPHETAANLPSKLTATQIKGRKLDEEIEENSEKKQTENGGNTADLEQKEGKILFDRPYFALEEKGLTSSERGTAHHLVMQYLNYDKTSDLENISEEIDRLVREEIITAQQGRAVRPKTIFSFFSSDLGQEMVKMGENLHREFKFSLLAPAGRYFPELDGEEETVLLQGVVDGWFDTPKGLVIVDFKSDFVTNETVLARAESYRPQLEAYAEALGELLKRPVFRKVLWFFATNQAIEL